MPERICLVLDGGELCGEPVHARGYCKRHHRRWYKTGDPLGVKPGRWAGYVKPRCSVEGCKNLQIARGRCQAHYNAWSKKERPAEDPQQTAARFESKINKSGPTILVRPDLGPCWLWRGYVSREGYANFTDGRGRTVRAHRWAWERENACRFPDGLEPDHLCHTFDPGCVGGPTCLHRGCCNPAHIEPVTHLVNVHRGRATLVERQARCQAGHERTSQNTYWYLGRPFCRICERDRSRRRNRSEPIKRQRGPKDDLYWLLQAALESFY